MRDSSAAAILVLAGLCTMTTASAAWADGAQSVIGGSAFGSPTGVIAVNQAAGAYNAQVNGASIALGDSMALAHVSAVQVMDAMDDVGGASATIAGGAFGNAQGLMQVNQAAGISNLQANLVAIAAGGVAVGDALLVQVRPDAPNAAPDIANTANDRQVQIADGAFAAASGIAQVNQTAGARNASANLFALVVTTTGANP